MPGNPSGSGDVWVDPSLVHELWTDPALGPVGGSVASGRLPVVSEHDVGWTFDLGNDAEEDWQQDERVGCF